MLGANTEIELPWFGSRFRLRNVFFIPDCRILKLKSLGVAIKPSDRDHLGIIYCVFLLRLVGNFHFGSTILMLLMVDRSKSKSKSYTVQISHMGYMCTGNGHSNGFY